MPIFRFSRQTILLMLGLALATPAIAGIRHHQAAVTAVKWEASSNKLHCTLSHEIPHYGKATFSQNAGEALQFRMSVERPAMRDNDKARLRSIPPAWKHHVSALDLNNIPVHKGDTPFQLDQPVALRMLAELEKGMFPTFSYRDWIDAEDLITVSLPGIDIKSALDDFIQCLAKLPVHKFEDYRNTLVKFAFGKAELTAAAKKRLDEVARYIKLNPGITQVEIGGHTDDIGKDPANDTLGKQRSTAVRNYLAGKGVDESLFRIVSHGEHQPVDSNKTGSGRANNRRATVVLKQ